MKELKIKLFSYDHRLLENSIKKIVQIADDTKASIKGPIPLPTKKEIFTICRSPHVNKPSREQFERRTHKRLLFINSQSQETIELLNKLILPSGVQIKIRL
ncbi:MAG: 30S ribosomal protein S10 [Mycoplasmoidaceae bacterium]